MVFPLILRAGLAIAPKVAKYARTEKFMGNVVYANSKALPAPAAAAAKAAPSALKTAVKNTAKVAPIGAIDAMSGGDKGTQASSSNVDEVVRITKQGIDNQKNPQPKPAPTPKATIKKAEKVVKVTAKPVADDANETPGGAVAIKDMGTKDSVQLHGNVDGYGSQHDLPEVKDPTEGMSEDALKKIGLDTSNAEMAARGDKGSLFGRLSEGNIDDPNSVAYKKYGAGYGREVLRRRAAGK